MKSLNVAILSHLHFNGRDVPLNVHISKIREDREDEVEYLNIDYNSDRKILTIDKTDNPFNYDNMRYVNDMVYYISFIDNENKLYDNYTKTFFEHYKIKSANHLLSMITYTEMIKLRDSVKYYIVKVKKTFMDNLIKVIDYDRKFPYIKVNSKSKTPKDILENMGYSLPMTRLQVVAEFPMGVWFKENEGVAFSNWSWREIEAKTMYVSMKYKIDGFTDKYQASKMDKKE